MSGEGRSGRGRGGQPGRPARRGGGGRADSGGVRRQGRGGAASVNRQQQGQTPWKGRGQANANEGLGGAQVEGRHAVLELLRAGKRSVRQVAISDTASGTDEVLAEIIDLAEARGVPLRGVSRDQLQAMAVSEAPQGVIAQADPVPEHSIEGLLARPGGQAPFLVVLDGVTDPHNLGAVMRSALCAGATGVVVARRRAAHLTPAAVKAAAGAVEHLPVAVVAGIPAALSELADAGVWTVGLDADGPASLWELPVATQPVAVVLGAEGRGLSSLVRKRCEVLARVPMGGPLASLNVAAAAALACFEVARRRAANPS